MDDGESTLFKIFAFHQYKYFTLPQNQNKENSIENFAKLHGTLGSLNLCHLFLAQLEHMFNVSVRFEKTGWSQIKARLQYLTTVSCSAVPTEFVYSHSSSENIPAMDVIVNFAVLPGANLNLQSWSQIDALRMNLFCAQICGFRGYYPPHDMERNVSKILVQLHPKFRLPRPPPQPLSTPMTPPPLVRGDVNNENRKPNRNYVSRNTNRHGREAVVTSSSHTESSDDGQTSDEADLKLRLPRVQRKRVPASRAFCNCSYASHKSRVILVIISLVLSFTLSCAWQLVPWMGN